jgi:histidine triad (HIT) family protein
VRDDCIFCRIIEGETKSWKIFENESVYAFLDINPVNEYHTLVVPKAHCTNLFDASIQQAVDVMSGVKQVVDLFNEVLGLENIQIINSSGKIAQQDVPHLHFHVIPRYKNDGQDIKLTFHPEMSVKFDELINRLESGN